MGKRRSTIAATGAAIAGDNFPGAILTNEDLERMLGDDPKTGTSAQWIKDMTGIEERRIAFGNTRELAIAAVRNLYETSDFNPKEVDFIIVGRNTPQIEYPSIAHMIAGDLELECGAFDLQCGCSAFGHALPVADSLIKTMGYNNIIVVGVDVLSKVTDFRDRDTCVLLADGGGSALVRASDKPGIIASYMGSKPDIKGYLTEEHKKGTKLEYVTNNLGGHFELGEEVEQDYLIMNGRQVKRFATGTATKRGAIQRSIEKVLESTPYGVKDIDLFVPHQANIRIIYEVADKMGIDREKFYLTLQKYGNSSTASYIIAYHEAVKSGDIKERDLVMMVAFGAGLSESATLMLHNANPVYIS